MGSFILLLEWGRQKERVNVTQKRWHLSEKFKGK